MKAKQIVKKAGNVLKVLTEGLFPANMLENQILMLNSLKTLLLQTGETRARLQELAKEARSQGINTESGGDTPSSADQNEPEERLLEFLLPRLQDRNLLDVGAHRGVFTAEMLRIGFDCIHAFEPHPGLSRALAEEYESDPRVTVHPLALSETEGPAVLHLVERFSNDSGEVDPLLFSSLSRHNMPPGLEFSGEVAIDCRSLSSLTAAGAVPASAAVLKIDAEGCDLSVMKGMPGGTPYEIIISEFWSEDFVFSTPGVPTQQEVRAFMAGQGYPHLISIVRKSDGSLCFTANMLPRIPQVWGNTMYFRDQHLFDAAYAFMANTMKQIA